MGNWIPKTNPPSEDHWKITKCMCGNIATYRCQIVGPWKQNHPELQKYWVWHYGQTNGFNACDTCILPELRKVFTHHPTGWKEPYKCHIDYENAIF